MAIRFARESAAATVAGVATTLAGFVSSVLVARLLGIEGTGVVAFASFIITVVVMACDLGVPGALARYLPELRAAGDSEAVVGLTRLLFRRLVSAALFATFAFAVYAALLWPASSQTLAPIKPESYRVDPLFWSLVASACLAQTLAGFVNGYLRGSQNFRRLAELALASAVVQIGTTILGTWLFGIAGALSAAITGALLPALLVPYALAPRTREAAPPGASSVPSELRQRVRRFAWESWAGYVVVAFAWSRMEIFFLERSWGSSSVGYFTVSLTLSNLATQGPLLLTGALLPHLSRQVGTGAIESARGAYRATIRLFAVVLFPACLGTAAIAPTLLPAIFGQAFAAAVPTAMVLVAAAAFSTAASVAFTYMLAMERTGFIFLSGGTGALLSIAAGLTVVPVYGPLAAGIARGTIQILIAAMALWYVDRKLGCGTPYGVLMRLFAAAMTCALTAWLCLQWVAGPAALPLAIGAAMLVYVLALRVLGALTTEDIERMRAGLAILPRPVHEAVSTLLGWLVV